MKSLIPLFGVLCGLLKSLPRQRRVQLVLLLMLMLIGAVAELASIGAVVPFLAILADPEHALQRPGLMRLVELLGYSDASDIRWKLTLLFALASVASGATRLVLLYAVAKFNFGMAHDLSSEVYRRTLHQPYSVHLASNSSQVIGGISKVDSVAGVIYGLLTGFSAALMGAFIIGALILIDPWVATLSMVGFGIIYVATSLLTRKQLAINSQVNNAAYTTRIQAVQEGLGGIRDVLLNHAQPVFCRRFNDIDKMYRQSQASTYFIGPSPRFAVEAAGMVLIALLAFTLTSREGGLGAAAPVLGALALGAQRLMPLMQQVYQGWVVVVVHRDVMQDVLDMVSQPMPSDSKVTVAPLPPLPFEHEIRFSKVAFQYQSHLAPVLRGVDLTIPCGARIGVVGQTGSGKSTVMDLLMGLSLPSSGQIHVDGQLLEGANQEAWQRNVAHVPQAIFLSDSSFAENIAFGVPVQDIDHERVRLAATKAQISAFIESTLYGYQTLVGERGARLSGGQRQRIGIARAFYRNAKVIVFDEATSALDQKTEAFVMEAIRELGRELTVILIAHRVSTLSRCDLVYRLVGGRLEILGGYEDLVNAENLDGVGSAKRGSS